MKLKEKTHRKFVDYFTEQNKLSQNKEFEIAFSEIQRTTGAASVTLKKALNSLVSDGFIKMIPGRNSRYAKFTVVDPQAKQEESLSGNSTLDNMNRPLTSLENDIDLLKRRIRSQEIAISLLQDRIAEIEDKLSGS